MIMTPPKDNNVDSHKKNLGILLIDGDRERFRLIRELLSESGRPYSIGHAGMGRKRDRPSP